MKIIPYLLLFFIADQSLAAQKKDSLNIYIKGYALKGNDTIACVIVSSDSLHTLDKDYSEVTLLIDGIETVFYPGGPIVGFGFEENGVLKDFGVLDVKYRHETELFQKTIYKQKLVSGIISLYVYRYTVYQIKTTSVKGRIQSGPTSLFQSFTDYYISKRSSTDSSLAKTVLLNNLNEKKLRPYFYDHPTILSVKKKWFSKQNLIIAVKEYNEWYIEKIKTK